MAKPFQMRQHRHARLAHHPSRQALAAARNDQIDGAVQSFQHQAHGGAVGVADILDGRFRQARRLQAFHHRGMNGAGGMQRIRTAAQNGDIAGLQRDRARIRRHIGAGFIDDADHADGRGDARDIQAIGPRPARQFAAIGIGLGRDIFDRLGHGFDPRIVERQPVLHRGRPYCSPWPLPGRGHWRPGFRPWRRGWRAAASRNALVLVASSASRTARAASRAASADGHHLGGQGIVLVMQGHGFSVIARSSRWIISSRPR